MTMTTVKDIKQEHFQSKSFLDKDIKMAGRALAKYGEAACIEYLQNAPAAQGNLKRPTKCNIIAVSRPLAEWPALLASANIQKHVYSLTFSELEEFAEAFSKPSKGSRESILKVIETHGYSSAQGLNLMIGNAISTYKGVLKKVDNRNKKKAERIARINDSRKSNVNYVPLEFVPESALDDEGHLINPPGINRNLFCYQGLKLRPYAPTILPKEGEKTRHIHQKLNLPLAYDAYDRDPDAPIVCGALDRLSVPKGELGYVPEHPIGWKEPLLQRHNLKKKGRVRLGGNKSFKASQAIIVIISVGDDWVAFDARGLLRQIRRLNLCPKEEELTVETILSKFTDSPVINPNEGVVTFMVDPALVVGFGKKPVHRNSTKKRLLDLCSTSDVALVSVDLNKNNTFAYRISRVRKNGEELEPEIITFGCYDCSTKEFVSLRSAHDMMEEDHYNKALSSLSLEDQALIKASKDSDLVKAKVCERLSISKNDIDWDSMRYETSFISKFCSEHGIENDDLLKTVERYKRGSRKGQIKSKKNAYDGKVIRKITALPSDVNERLQKARWKFQKESSSFKRLAERKRQVANAYVNKVIVQAKKLSQCDVVAFVVEDGVNKFHGGGVREIGLDSLLRPKKEGRWLIQAFYRSITDLAPNKGIDVLMIDPRWTSTTCIVCGNVDKANRSSDNKEEFICTNTKCGDKRNADIEVATFNIQKCALTGRAMPGPEKRERSSDGKKSRTSRRTKAHQIIDEIHNAAE